MAKVGIDTSAKNNFAQQELCSFKMFEDVNKCHMYNYLRAKRSASQWIINMRSEGQGWFTFLEYFVNSDIKRPEKHANIGFQGRTAQFRGQI